MDWIDPLKDFCVAQQKTTMNTLRIVYWLSSESELHHQLIKVCGDLNIAIASYAFVR